MQIITPGRFLSPRMTEIFGADYQSKFHANALSAAVHGRGFRERSHHATDGGAPFSFIPAFPDHAGPNDYTHSKKFRGKHVS